MICIQKVVVVNYLFLNLKSSKKTYKKKKKQLILNSKECTRYDLFHPLDCMLKKTNKIVKLLNMKIFKYK